MRTAYLILAHNTPNHLPRLLSALAHDSAFCFVHVDGKIDLGPYLALEGDGVAFLRRRERVYWGDYSIVAATLRLMRRALADPRDFQRYVVLSGADFPVRSAAYVDAFFARFPETEFIDHLPVPEEATGRNLQWITYYRLRPPGERGPGQLARQFFRKTGLAPKWRDPKKFIGDMVPYCGDAWWALTRDAVEYTLHFVDQSPRAVELFRHAWVPDESMFQTILCNSRFREAMAGCLTWADWSARWSHPEVIGERHLEVLAPLSAEAEERRREGYEILFARKFADDSADLVARILRQTADQEPALLQAAERER